MDNLVVHPLSSANKDLWCGSIRTRCAVGKTISPFIPYYPDMTRTIREMNGSVRMGREEGVKFQVKSDRDSMAKVRVHVESGVKYALVVNEKICIGVSVRPIG
jgi:hypothetical protein